MLHCQSTVASLPAPEDEREAAAAACLCRHLPDGEVRAAAPELVEKKRWTERGSCMAMARPPEMIRRQSHWPRDPPRYIEDIGRQVRRRLTA